MKKSVWNRKFAVIALSLVAVLALSGTAGILAQEDTTLTGIRVEAGLIDPLDVAWATAPVLNVVLSAEGEIPPVYAGLVYEPASEVALQAVYTDDMIYIRSVWADDTEGSTRALWTFTETGWVKSGLNEDRLSFMFDITGNRQFAALGCGAACHDATAELPAYMGFPADSTDALDLWHWKATRTPEYADDTWAGAVVVGDETTGRASDSKESGGYVDNKNEAGDGPRFIYAEGANRLAPLYASEAVEITADMTFSVGQTVSYYVQTRPVGSRGDIDAYSSYVRANDGSGMWYVVLARPFSTGNPDDTTFSLSTDHVFGVAVFNNAGGSNHSASESKLVLTLGE